MNIDRVWIDETMDMFEKLVKDVCDNCMDEFCTNCLEDEKNKIEEYGNKR